MAETVTEILNFYFWTENRLINFSYKNIEVRWHRGTLGTIFQFYNPKPEVVLPNFLCHAKRSTNPENTKGVGDKTREK